MIERTNLAVAAATAPGLSFRNVIVAKIRAPIRAYVAFSSREECIRHARARVRFNARGIRIRIRPPRTGRVPLFRLKHPGRIRCRAPRALGKGRLPLGQRVAQEEEQTSPRIDRSRGRDCSITTTAARRAFPTIERSLAGLASGCALKSPFNLLQGVSGSHAASSHAADLPLCGGLCMCARRNAARALRELEMWRNRIAP